MSVISLKAQCVWSVALLLCWCVACACVCVCGQKCAYIRCVRSNFLLLPFCVTSRSLFALQLQLWLMMLLLLFAVCCVAVCWLLLIFNFVNDTRSQSGFIYFLRENVRQPCPRAGLARVLCVPAAAQHCTGKRSENTGPSPKSRQNGNVPIPKQTEWVCVLCAVCTLCMCLAVCSRASCHACICLLSTVCFCCCCYCCCQCVATLSVCSWCQSHIECIIIVDSFLLLLAPNTVSYGKNVHMLLPNESINALSMPPAATVCANDFVCDVMPL